MSITLKIPRGVCRVLPSGRIAAPSPRRKLLSRLGVRLNFSALLRLLAEPTDPPDGEFKEGLIVRIRLVVTVAVLAGCGSGEEGKPSTPRAGVPLSETENDEDATGVEQDKAGAGEDAAYEGAAGDEAAGGEAQSLDALARSCGVADLGQPQQEQLGERLVGVPVTQSGRRDVPGLGGVDYTVTVTGTLQLTANLLASKATPRFNAAAQPAVVQGVANEEAAKRSGLITTDFLPFAERPQLGGRSAGWDGVVCAVQPAVRITAELGDSRVVSELDPPLPTLVSPKIDAARYAKELGDERIWTGITARVRQSRNPAVTAGSTYAGTARLRSIPTSFDLPAGAGGPQRIVADHAFELSYDFGGPEVTSALGLTPVTRFYIDAGAKSYKAVVVEFGDPTLPAAVYLPE